jgi:hypothetical protein
MLKASEIQAIKLAVLDFIDDNDIIEYADLVKYLRAAELRDEAWVAMDNTFFFNSYISSRRNSYSRLGKKIDKKRNELLSPDA